MRSKRLRAQRRGVELVKKGHYEEAKRVFSNKEIERSTPVSIAAYALTMAALGKDVEIAIELCQKAKKRDSNNPIIGLCPGRLYILCGDKGRAFKTFMEGLHSNAGHRELTAELRAFKERSLPPIRLLNRSHPLNRVLGKSRTLLNSDVKEFPDMARAAYLYASQKEIKLPGRACLG